MQRHFRIAFVSYEFLGLSSGGIGTYTYNIAKTMGQRGHDVHVFTAQSGPSSHLRNVVLHTIDSRPEDFSRNVLPAFSKAHADVPFDVVEAAEYRADAFDIARTHPGIARIVKLATPAFLVAEINHAYLPVSAKLRFLLGGMRKCRVSRPYWWYKDNPFDRERIMSENADELTSPSKALLDAVARRWRLDKAKCHVVPYAFPLPDILEKLPVENTSRTVLFLGKLEARKGVIEIADAIPKVASALPDVRFRFVGRSLHVPGSDLDMKSFLMRRLGPHADLVDFSGDMRYEDALKSFEHAAICVFPSYWEAFGFVALEAMSAGRSVIGSASGGMAEIIENGRTGELVQPGDPNEIASRIIHLMKHPARRFAMGHAARRSVKERYSTHAIGPMQEASYLRAMARAQHRVGSNGT